MSETNRSKTTRSAYYHPGPSCSLDQSIHPNATNKTGSFFVNDTHTKMASKSISTSTIQAQDEQSALNAVRLHLPVSTREVKITITSFVTVQRTTTTTYKTVYTVPGHVQPGTKVTTQSIAQEKTQETAQETAEATNKAAACSSSLCSSTSLIILTSQKTTTSSTKSAKSATSSAKTSQTSTAPILLSTQNIASQTTKPSSPSVPVATTSKSNTSSTSSAVQSQLWTTIFTTPLGPGCLTDNCLRALSHEGGIGASSFCSYYTLGLGPTTFPTYATMCGPSTSSSLFSACSCYNYMTSSSTKAEPTELSITYLPPFLPTISPNPTSLLPLPQPQIQHSGSPNHLSKAAKAGIILGILLPLIIISQIWLRFKKRRLVNPRGRNTQPQPQPQPSTSQKRNRNRTSLISCCATSSSTSNLIHPPPPPSPPPRALSILPKYDGPVYHPYSSSKSTSWEPGHLDENGIRWPEKVVLKGESKEFHDWTRQYQKEQVAKMRLRNGGGGTREGMWMPSGEGPRKGEVG